MRILKSFKNIIYLLVVGYVGFCIGIIYGDGQAKEDARHTNSMCIRKVLDKENMNNMKKLYGHSSNKEMGNVYNHSFVYNSFKAYRCFLDDYLYKN